MIPDKTYDIIVVGAGPAGCMAALKAVQGGASVLLLEKHGEIGRPVCCAEGITTFGLERVIRPHDDWICSVIGGASLTSPSGRTVTLARPRAGYVLDRAKFDSGLARLAAGFGVDISCSSPVVGLNLIDDGSIKGVIVDCEGKRIAIDSKVVIAADGVESEVAALAGIFRNYELKDVYSACQYQAENVPESDPGIIRVFLGNRIAPGGYAWAFPKGNGRANIGVAISAGRGGGRSARDYLDSFVNQHFPGINRKNVVMGVVPTFNSRMPLVKRNLMITGDAARLVDSLSGAGISNALLSGAIAGEVAARHVLAGENLEAYPWLFWKHKRRDLQLYKFLHRIYVGASDKELERLVEAIERFFPEKKIQALNFPGMIIRFLFRNPGLLGLQRYWRRNETKRTP